MAYDLQQLITAIDDQIETLDAREIVDRTVRQISAWNFPDLKIEVDDDVMQAAVLRVPLPKIVLIEGPNGEFYTVISGAKVLGTMLAVARDEENFTPRHLVRRITETVLNLVVFRCNMRVEDAKLMASKLGYV